MNEMNRKTTPAMVEGIIEKENYMRDIFSYFT